MGKPEDAMEPSAELKGDQWRYSITSSDHSLRSIAISLTRIADRLDDIASGTASLNVDVRQP